MMWRGGPRRILLPMIWAILAALGIPLWFLGLAFIAMMLENRKLRNRYGNVAVRVRRPGKKRWERANAIWVSDVFVWRGSPGVWKEGLMHVSGLTFRSPDADERKRLRRLDAEPAIATLTAADGEVVEVATAAEQRAALAGPFAASDGDQGSGPQAKALEGASQSARP